MVTATVPLEAGSGPFGAGFIASTETAYFSSLNGTVSAVDGATNTIDGVTNTGYTTDDAASVTAWRITTVVARPKSVPVDASAFSGASGARTLSLITCGGAYDSASSSYDYNVYVTATPAT